MKLSEFLNAVVPVEGVRIVARMRDGRKPNGKEFKYFQHLPCNDHTQMQQAIAQMVKATKADIYYALGSFKQSFHENSKGKKVIRVRQNVSKLKALWFDIDFKDGLSNPTEVVAALREFSNRTGMPVPSILVHSGNGMHCYWPFTQEVPLDDWLPMAEALKSLGKAHALAADLACTADPCRVLRPVGSVNWKDPENPKVVKGSTTGQLFSPDDLRAALLGGCATHEDSLGPVPEYLNSRTLDTGSIESLSTQHRSVNTVEHFWTEITKSCGVARYYAESKGADCSEPEWTAGLQLLRHCTDGELFYHDISSGHPDYDADDTRDKWQQRVDNDAGPTLCETFHGYREDICKVCPHFRKIKTPLSLGEEKEATVSGKEFPLKSWRPVPGNMGMERKMFDPGSNQYFWEKALKRTWELTHASRGLNDGVYSYTIVSRLGDSNPVEIDLPGSFLGSTPDLKKCLAEAGCPLPQGELGAWMDLMSTWLQEIQKNRHEREAVDRLGWMEKINGDQMERIGFTAGDTCYLSDGTVKSGLRVAAEYKEVAKHYTARGNYDQWKKPADFLAEQNNPAFTAILASAFAAPIFGYTNMPGAMLTVVSSESGLGKTSAMRVAQAVWGSPANGINSTSDTYLSVIRKVAFLNNLPIYWDEIRGERSLENFYRTAFDVAQGKERTRLDSGAKLRTVNSWKTMVVGASNESLFDYMAQQGGASDAATARTFEIVVDPFEDAARASHNAMFGTLDSNYGFAGAKYSEFLALNELRIHNMTTETYERLYSEWSLHEGERFWAAICASLIVGAKLAGEAGIVDIDVKALAGFLKDNVSRLRIRTNSSMLGATPRELVVGYIQAHQKGQMIIDKFPAKGQTVQPIVQSPPSDRLMIVTDQNGYTRFRKQDFVDWLRTSKHMTFSAIEKAMVSDLSMKECNVVLGSSTKWQMPKCRCLEVYFSE
jgi:hypothetical protein